MPSEEYHSKFIIAAFYEMENCENIKKNIRKDLTTVFEQHIKKIETYHISEFGQKH